MRRLRTLCWRGAPKLKCPMRAVREKGLCPRATHAIALYPAVEFQFAAVATAAETKKRDVAGKQPRFNGVVLPPCGTEHAVSIGGEGAARTSAARSRRALCGDAWCDGHGNWNGPPEAKGAAYRPASNELALPRTGEGGRITWRRQAVHLGQWRAGTLRTRDHGQEEQWKSSHSANR